MHSTNFVLFFSALALVLARPAAPTAAVARSTTITDDQMSCLVSCAVGALNSTSCGPYDPNPTSKFTACICGLPDAAGLLSASATQCLAQCQISREAGDGMNLNAELQEACMQPGFSFNSSAFPSGSAPDDSRGNTIAQKSNSALTKADHLLRSKPMLLAIFVLGSLLSH
ncbi:hypothetical protein C8J57DRAFT_70917 [Mycena rebaudengoi]|nr:hypothetical protein C8J57DRAFT_70917 [Mycena rebaudengoi]